MIVFGTAVSDRALYRKVALPSIERVREPGSVVRVREGFDSIQEPYNQILEEAGALEDLEALVLLHQDLELTDDTLLDRIRPVLQDPAAGLIGVLGWRGAKIHQWISDGEKFGRSVAPEVSFHHSSGCDEVEMVDGVLLVLSPWVVRSLRFDERLARDFHGYDIDFSLRVRAAGGKVLCIDIPYLHHMEKPWRDRDEWVRAATTLSLRWQPEMRPEAWAASFCRGPRGVLPVRSD